MSPPMPPRKILIIHRLNLVLRNTERGAVSNEAIFVKYYPDFKLSPGNLERKLKFYFIDNILDR